MTIVSAGCAVRFCRCVYAACLSLSFFILFRLLIIEPDSGELESLIANLGTGDEMVTDQALRTG